MPRTATDALRPMLASLADAPRVSSALVYEPKYDGIRAIVEIGPASDLVSTSSGSRGPTPARSRSAASRLARAADAGPDDVVVRIWSRLGNEKTFQFPELTKTFEGVGRAAKGQLVIDGEIVALDERGRPAGFQRLQGRMHLTGAVDIARAAGVQPVAFIAFDLLFDADDDLRARPWSERRGRLEARLTKLASADGPLRLSEVAHGDGRALERRAETEGWEGIIAKELRAPYHSGRRSPAWRKLKIVRRQEFVVGGWTDPRNTRSHFGALLLGVAAGDSKLKYVGHVGTGFDEKQLARVAALLKSRATPTSPFTTRVPTNEAAHWVRPELVAEVRFTEWTDEGYLRHPVYLGLRDDKKASDVTVEGARGQGAEARKAPAARASKRLRPARGASGASRRAPAGGGGAPPALKNAGGLLGPAERKVIDQLLALEDARRDGVISLPNGDSVKVTNLAKVFWPDGKITKGELLRYYVQVSRYLLPAVADRPLVMKRFPNGITGQAFYQQRSREEKPPPGVRIEILADELDPIDEPGAKRLIGGSLTTLLYMTQIAAISQDPWFSRVQSPLYADYVALDLDPVEGATFGKILDVARWTRDELGALGVPGVPKTSGSSGLHIYIPLPPKTTYESGQLLCQIIATSVAAKHPKAATIERTVRARPRGTVYVDYLQNILGKTLATAYSARASPFAGVSTPLTWKEVDAGVDPRNYTVRTAPARFAEVGDLWARLRTSKPADLTAIVRRIQTRSAGKRRKRVRN